MTNRFFCFTFFIFLIVAVCSGCGSVTPVASIPDAENALVTQDGRLFVSGSLNLYEITQKENGAFQRHTLMDTDCSFTGIVEYNGYLYTVKNSPGKEALSRPEPVLLIAALSDIVPTDSPKAVNDLWETMELPGLSTPNGLAVDDRGWLFSADTQEKKIIRFDIDETDPTVVIGPFDSGLEGLQSPNGMSIEDGVLYYTDGNSVKKSEITDKGALLPSETLYTAQTVLDDLMVYQKKILVCNYMRGTLVCLSTDGDILYETPVLTFAFPSSVRAARGSMFGSNSVIVTEKGILNDTGSSIGNRVVVADLKL